MAATKHAQLIKNDSIEYLTTALMQLLETTDFNDIKISQLVKRAGVSRMAFYRNFDTLEDVLRNYFETLIGKLFDDIIDSADHEDKLLRLSQFFSRLEVPIKLSIQRHYEDILRQAFFDNMIRLYANDPRLETLSASKRRYWVSFMSAGVYNVWRDWILHDKAESIDEIKALITALQTATFAALS